ncbi:MAG: putative methylase protein [Micavibrio sp.]|nr:putative methylase protein [Micavibrio sp.]
MSVNNFITLPYKLERDPPPFEANDIKYPEPLVRHFLKEFTKRGDKIFDPFAGLGTTLFVAEEMGRIPFGIEYDERRFEWVAGQMRHWGNLACGDSLKLAKLGFPKMDFCMTSPPFMPKGDKWNPLSAGNPAKAGYATYLKQMQKIFTQVGGVMKKNARIVVHVDNIPGRIYTPLVRDLSIAVGDVLSLENEIVVAWKNAKPDYPHTHCLVFRNR